MNFYFQNFEHKINIYKNLITQLYVRLITGRKHQIRVQLALIGCPIKGDLKYGFDRSNKDASISLHARTLRFMHPVKKEEIRITAPLPEDPLWKACTI